MNSCMHECMNAYIITLLHVMHEPAANLFQHLPSESLPKIPNISALGFMVCMYISITYQELQVFISLDSTMCNNYIILFMARDGVP